MSKLAKFRLEALNAHNSYRKMHDVPPLEYDAELESSAQDYADELIEADELRVSHGASLGIFGENISRRTSSSKRKPDISGAEVTSLWYRDIEKFDYARGAGRAGNFTQLVWRDTRYFGISKAQAAGRVVVVAHYSPAGNVRGHFLENVPPPVAAEGAAAGDGGRRGSREPATGGSTAQDPSEDPLFNYRVKSRQVDTQETREGRAAVLVRRELVEYEDGEGHTKQKLVEERQRKQLSSGSGQDDDDSRSGGSGGSVAEDEQESSRTAGHQSPSEGSQAGSSAPTQNSAPPAPEAAAEHLAIQSSPESTRRAAPRCNPVELHRFAKHVLNAVNHHRKHHDSRSLRLNGELCEMAQLLAEQLAVRAEKLQASTVTYRGQRLGQSLAARVSAANTDASAEHVVGLWYAEGRRYDYRAEPADIEPFGNFTQLVWKASQELGVGRCVAQLPNGSYKLVVVCYYFPTGNVSNEFIANVLPPKK